MNQSLLISRRGFHVLAGSALAQGPQSPTATASAKHAHMLPKPRTIKCLNCDLN